MKKTPANLDLKALARQLLPLLKEDAAEAKQDDLPGKLDYLAELYEKQVKLQSQIPDELQIQLSAVADAIDNVKAAITAAVAERGATVAGTSLQAVYAKGRPTWDSKALDAYSINVPELQKYRKEGKPYVTIRPRANNN